MKNLLSRMIYLFAVITILSCNNDTSSKTSESELINKVNAVMEQIAVQGNVSDEEKQAIISLANLVKDENNAESYNALDDAISFDKLDVKPIYVGCTEETSENCFKVKIDDLIEKEFNKDLLNKTEIQGETTIEYFLLIDKNGNISNRKIRETNVVVLAELARVLKLIPKMKPGLQNGKPVNVMYNGTFTYGTK